MTYDPTDEEVIIDEGTVENGGEEVTIDEGVV